MNLFFDIETVANEETEHLWPKRQAVLEKQGKEFIPELIPEFCKIVALGWAVDDGFLRSLVIGTDAESKTDGMPTRITEQLILKQFWALAIQTRPTLIGFNILGYDLPVIFVRSMMLGIKPTRQIDRRPWGKDCIDLFDARRYTAGGGGLKHLAECYGIENLTPEVDGSQVKDLDPKTIAKYVRSDVHLTRELYKLYKGFFVK